MTERDLINGYCRPSWGDGLRCVLNTDLDEEGFWRQCGKPSTWVWLVRPGCLFPSCDDHREVDCSVPIMDSA